MEGDGIDNVLWLTTRQKFEAIKELGKITNNPKNYKSSPLKKELISSFKN